MKDLRRPFTFGTHTIGHCCIGRYRGVIRLEWHVKAVESSSGVGCLVVCLGGDEALGIGSPREFDGFQEVAQDILEPFKVVVSWFPVDGRPPRP